MDEDRLRLVKLIEHWIEHNDEHGGRFSEEADKAEKLGFKDVAVELYNASKASGVVSEKLSKALKLLGESV